MMIDTMTLLNLLWSGVKNLFSQMMSVGSDAGCISISCPTKYLYFEKSSYWTTLLYMSALL